MKRQTQRLSILLPTALLIIALGCAESDSGNQQASSDGVAPPPAAPAQPAPLAPAPPAPVVSPPTPPVADPPANNNDDNDAVAAEVGFGAKGQYDSRDYISVTVGAQFRVQEQITLLNVMRAMRQYKALNNGYPKSGEVFFKEIIKENGIALPELPAGQQFGYDPELAAETDAEQSLIILKPKKP